VQRRAVVSICGVNRADHRTEEPVYEAQSGVAYFMKLRATIPLSAYVTAEHPDDLSPTTAFAFRDVQVHVEFLGDPSLELPGPPGSHFTRLRGMRIELTGGERLQTLLSPEKGEALLKVLVKVTNRILSAIRNFGTVAHVQPIKVDADTDAWLRALGVESSDDDQTWSPVRVAPSFETLLMDRFLLFQEKVGELNVQNWGLVEEAIQDDLKAGPEREFYVNALEHSRVGNLRLAVVESVICLEIVLTQWLHVILPQRGVVKVKDMLRPQLDLNTRLKLLLPLLLEKDLPPSINLDDVARNVGFRNKVVHDSGNLPDVATDLIRSGVSATLQLARWLAVHRDRLVRQSELDNLGEAIGTAFGLPKPKVYQVDRHDYSVFFDFPFPGELPNDERLEAIAHGVHEKVAGFDPRYRPGRMPAVPSVSFGQLNQTISVWLDGKLRRVAKPKPTGLLNIARLLSESNKGQQEC
jgi:hypothetical protein